MPRNQSERIPRVILERQVRHKWDSNLPHSLRLHSVTPKLWRLTLAPHPSANAMEQFSRNFRDIEEARDVYHEFPATFLHFEDTTGGDGWYHDQEAEERGT